MEIRDGFIVGVYNYCDSWCGRCAFTSRCLVFADKCEMEATLDPNLEPVALAPCLPDVPSPPPPWLKELLEEMDEASRSPLPDDVWVQRARRVVPERDAIDDRAEAYSRRVRAWLNTREFDLSSKERRQGVPADWKERRQGVPADWKERRQGVPADWETGDPRDVIAWFHMMIHVKAMRALHGLAEDDPAGRDWPADHDGSAKVALIGIDCSHTAWLDLVEVGLASPADAASFIDDLIWLRAALERTFPNARAFVRPGFDEPDEVARLLRSESEA
jgi:hypothetical protein